MGKWKGTAPLSSDADWSHGPVLQLKYDTNSKNKAQLPDDVVKRIGSAYDMAIVMLAKAIAVTQDAKLGKYEEFSGFRTVKELFEQYFGKEPDLNTMLSTLSETLAGLKSNDKKNRIYLFDDESKPDVKKKAEGPALGYVSRYDLDVKGSKKKRPTVGLYKRGHIHINHQERDTTNLAATIIHEGTHRFAGTADVAYADDMKFTTLTAAEQLNNADSYSEFSRTVWMRLL